MDLFLDILYFLGVFIVPWLVLYGIVRWFYPRRVIIYEYERGLKYNRGHYDKTLKPGVHFHNAAQKIVKVDVREQVLTLRGQEVLTADGIPVRISAAIGFRIETPDQAINEVASFHQSLYTKVQLGLRAVIGNVPVEELLQKRAEVGPMVLEDVKDAVSQFGLTLTMLDVKDITFSARLKKIFSEELRAKKEGLAALERARGESAALRKLANAAKAFEKNPNLMKLRLIQALSESEGNTLVVNLTEEDSPLVLKGKS